MTDKRDICERLGVLESLVGSDWCRETVRDAKAEIERLREREAVFTGLVENLRKQRDLSVAEVERQRAIVAEARAKPYHYMTADGKTITAAELEAQRNAAWRGLVWIGRFVAKQTADKDFDMWKAACEEMDKDHGEAFLRANIFVLSEQATQETKP